MTFFYLIILGFQLTNPRIIQDTLTPAKNVNTDKTGTLINFHGEKLFSASGTDNNADVFQSTSIVLSGKTENGWEVEGLLYDDKLKPTEDLYTIGLSDVNTAYLVIHRIKDSFVFGRFNLYGKSVDGGMIKYNYSHMQFTVGGGKTRGPTGTFDTIIIPPYNVPVKITLKNIQYFTIVEHSEEVYINGRRASKKEYSIDYTGCVITLYPIETPPEINLHIEFEYHSIFENPYIYGTEFSYKHRLFQTQVKWLSENTMNKVVYDSTGGIFLPDGGGDYDKVDSIFVYRGNGKGHYRVFFRVDTLEGAYRYDERGFYVFVGNGMGNYSPVVFNRPPLLRDLKEFSFKAGANIYTKFKYISSFIKTTKEKSHGIELAGGITRKNLDFEAGMRSTYGNPQLINTRFDTTRDRYTNIQGAEKFAHLTLRGNKLNAACYLVYDTTPAWYVNLKSSGFYIFSRGKNSLKDMLLTYKKKNNVFSAFLTSCKTRGVSFKTQIKKLSSISGSFFQDSLKVWHYITIFSHAQKSKTGNVKIDLTKTDRYLLYGFVSSLSMDDALLSMSIKRTLDFGQVYMARYVKSDEGYFEYDSTLSEMVPSEFGSYTRIITSEKSENINYRYTYGLSGSTQRKTWQGTFDFSLTEISGNKEMNITMYNRYRIFNGIALSGTYKRTRYRTIDGIQKEGFLGELKLFFLTETHISPGVFTRSWKDPFTSTEKYSHGTALNINLKKLYLVTEISRNTCTLINGSFWSLKGNITLNAHKTTITVTGRYSTIKKSILPDESFFGASAQKSVHMGNISTVILVNMYITSRREVKWKASTTLKF